MKKNLTIGVPIIALLATAFGIFFLTQDRPGAERLPVLSPRSGESSPSAEFLNAGRAVEHCRKAIAENPEVVKNYVELAQLYLQEARATGNGEEYVPAARRLIEEALRRDPLDQTAKLTMASLLLTLHHFAEAGEIAAEAVRENPHSAEAWGILSDAETQLGRYAEAVEACDRMLGLRPDLRSYARAAYLRELHGDLRGAIQVMSLAAEAGVTGQENRAWTLYNLGKLYLAVGAVDTAEAIFTAILEERPGYGYALSGIASVRKAQGDYPEAIYLMKRAFAMTPEHHFLDLLAELYGLGEDSGAERMAVETVIEEYGHQERAGFNIGLDYAEFCAQHGVELSEALDRIEEEYEVRPENIEVLGTYAWLLHRTGKFAEAVPLIERAMRLGTRDATLLDRALLIYEAAGTKGKVGEYRRKVS